MKKYIAKLMFNINIDNGKNAHQFEEQTRIIESQNIDSAFHKAWSVGKNEEEAFINNENKKVNWQFIDVVELYEIESYTDGEQMCSTTHENKERNSFIDYVKHKAMLLQIKSLNFA